jgi:L-alanine-DL-glutamate epimerase-like enolase superfamily enzyme
MEITDIRVHALAEESKGLVTSYEGLSDDSGPAGTIKYTLVRVLTDADVEGHYMLWSEVPDARPEPLADVLGLYKQYLVGEDPLDRERLWQTLSQLWYGKRGPALAAVDVALWDIAGKLADLPIYRLLGAYRDEIRAYVSGNPAPSQDVVDLAAEMRDEGFTAMKLHPLSVEQCEQVRETVGEDVDLMHDPVYSYDRREALTVGRRLEELDFYWYEAPIPPTDVEGYVQLCDALDVPVTVELNRNWAEFVRRGAVDRVRSMNGFTGGITEMRKVAHLAEFHGLKWEPHTYGGTFYQAANLHALLATENATFFELPIVDGEVGGYDVGVEDVIRVDDDGYVQPPEKPGIGIDVDWDAVHAGEELEV